MGFSWHFSLLAASGPPATKRGNVYDGYTALHCVSGWLFLVCGSEMNCVEVGQHPSTASAGLLRITFRRSGTLELSAFMAITHSFRTCQAVSCGTSVPRHMTWLLAWRFASISRSRMAKWYH